MFKAQVLMSEELRDKVDGYASKMSVNRSAFCAMAIAEKVMSLDAAFGAVQGVADRLSSQLEGQMNVSDFLKE